MATETLKLLDGDVSKEARKLASPKHVDFKQAVFKVNYVIDSELAEKLDTDARFVSRLYGDITKEYEDLVQKVAAVWKQADDLGGIIPLSGAERKELVKDVRALFDKYKGNVEDKVERAVKRWLQVGKDRNQYKKDVKVNVALGVWSVGTGVGSVGLGVVTGGASLVLTIITITKGAAALYKEARRTWQGLETAQKKLHSTVQELAVSYHKHSENRVGAKEVGKSVVAEFFSYEMTGIKRAENEFLTYKGKLATSYEEVSKVGKSLHQYLDAQTQLDKSFEQLDKLQRQRSIKSKAFAKVERQVELNKSEVRYLIDSIATWDKTLSNHEKFGDAVDKALSELKSKNPAWSTGLQLVVKLASVLANPAIEAALTKGENLSSGWEAVKSGFKALEQEFKP